MLDSPQHAPKKVGMRMTLANVTVVLIRPIKKSTHSGTIWKLTTDKKRLAPKKVGKHT